MYDVIREDKARIYKDEPKAVTSGQRSGSGKIVLEFYDQLVQLWGGSPATEPLPSGVSTHGIDKGLPTNAVVDGGGNIDEELGTTLQEDVEIEEEPTTSKLNAKRKNADAESEDERERKRSKRRRVRNAMMIDTEVEASASNSEYQGENKISANDELTGSFESESDWEVSDYLSSEDSGDKWIPWIPCLQSNSCRLVCFVPDKFLKLL
eukprot:gene20754-22780_t